MAVSVINRPYAWKFQDTANVKQFGDFFGVGVTWTSHGISDNTPIYIKSIIDEYNGIFYTDFVNANFFRIKRDFEGTDLIDYILGDRTVECEVYVLEFNTGSTWNCVHLPIVYKLTNTLWPTNSEDTARTISSVTDSNGYCALSLSGDIKATGSAAALEFIKISSATNDELNGTWQITSYTNDTTFTIAIAYSSANDTALTGASIQYYYNNYHVKVRVYGGLNSGHALVGLKPYEVLATLDMIPDEDNMVVFSISEILKSQIEIKNNLLLSSLPNNLDAFTKFYIELAEAYDDSDGTTLSILTSSYTDDSGEFQGHAVNAKMPFKNKYSGALSEYSTGSTNQKFLTPFETPVIFSGHYFDISFINSLPGVALTLRQEYYLNGSLQDTEDLELIEGIVSDDGVYRVGLDDPHCDYDRVDVEVFISGTEELSNADFQDGMEDWSNAGSGETWTAGSFYGEVTVTGVQNSKRLEHAYNFYVGCSYQLNWELGRGSSGGGDNFLVAAYLSNDDFTSTQAIGGAGPFTTDGTTSEVDTFTADNNYTKLVFIVNANIP
jgi:hypothetical protein